MPYLRIITIILIITVALPGHCNAQEGDIKLVNNELSAGVGFAPVIPSGDLRGIVYNLSYNKLLSDFFTVGVSAGMSGSSIWRWDREDKTSRFIALLGSLRANFISERYFKLYVSLGIGGMYGKLQEKNNANVYSDRFDFAWHGGAGAEYGDLYVLFIEAGMGCRGILSLGVRIRF